MGMIKDVVKDEQRRLQQLIVYYQKQIAEFPCGGVSWKKRYHKSYAYLVKRVGEKVKFEYLGVEGASDVLHIMDLIEKRKNIENQLKEARENLKEVEGLLRERKK